MWKIEKCGRGEEDSVESFDNRRVAVFCNSITLDLENSKSQKTTEGGSGGMSGVKDGEAAGEFAVTIEPSDGKRLAC